MASSVGPATPLVQDSPPALRDFLKWGKPTKPGTRRQGQGNAAVGCDRNGERGQGQDSGIRERECPYARHRSCRTRIASPYRLSSAITSVPLFFPSFRKTAEVPLLFLKGTVKRMTQNQEAVCGQLKLVQGTIMVQWESGRRSENVDDRRSMGPRGVAMGGIGTVVMLIVVFLVSGGDLGQVLRFFLANQGQIVQKQPANQAPNPEDDEMAEFAKVILADTEDVWTKLFAEMGRDYPKPTMVLYRNQVQSGCGNASSAAGPFYCPADQRLYLDLSFFEELDRRFGAPGDFARAYVIAHEVAHHVQNQLGLMDRRKELVGRGMSENEFSVRLELQADFLAGVWAHHAQDERKILDPGDIDEGLRAAAAIGDDTLQKKSQGYVVKESFTHGSSAQRVRWFKKGFETGDIRQGDTFGTDNL